MKKQFVLVSAAIIFWGILPLAAQAPQNGAGNSAGKQDTSAASQSPDRAAIEKNVEAYLRHFYAWGPGVALSITQLEKTPVEGLYKVQVTVGMHGQSDFAIFYVSSDGKYMISGELQSLAADPLADVRKQISLDDSPSKGPANAEVTLVEYGDFECPSCKAAEPALRSLMPKYPQVRLIFKDFPLIQMHPWAMTAALAGRCTYEVNHDAFWKFHDLVYDNQDLISTANAYEKLQDYATQAGISDAAALRACMADPKTTQAVQASAAEGQKLHVANTPTIFVNGRRLIGGDPTILEQYIRYDLHLDKETPQP